jgi:hypothetical protein
MILRLTESDQLTLTLELRRVAAVPTGELVEPDGSRTEFEGWLQLLSAITSVLAAENTGGTTPSPR